MGKNQNRPPEASQVLEVHDEPLTIEFIAESWSKKE